MGEDAKSRFDILFEGSSFGEDGWLLGTPRMYSYKYAQLQMDSYLQLLF